MKKLPLLLLTLAPGLFAHAQVVKINILSPLFRTANIAYEQAISENGSLQLGFFYTGVKLDNTLFRGFGITPEYRFYLSETAAPEGVYVAPFVRYQNFTLTEEGADGKATYSSFGGGLILGKQWVFKDKITIDVFLGPAYYSGNLKVESGSEDDFSVDVFDGFSLRTGITFGFKF